MEREALHDAVLRDSAEVPDDLHDRPRSGRLASQRVWLYRGERFLSHRVLRAYTAVLDAACKAWNRLTQESGRLGNLTGYAYLLRSEGISWYKAPGFRRRCLPKPLWLASRTISS
jgi:hypothetical protein